MKPRDIHDREPKGSLRDIPEAETFRGGNIKASGTVGYGTRRRIAEAPHLLVRMARLARAVAAGLPHHITQRGTDQQRIFFTDGDRNVYLDLLATSAVPARLRVLAYCLMSNHLHLVAVPEEPTSLAVALRRAHGRYAHYLNARRNRSGHLFQNRFFSCALDTKHLFAALSYVERNPLRARLAESPEAFPWSSAAAHLSGRDPRGLLDLDFWRDVGGAERWRGLLASPEELAVIRLLQRGTFSGRPVGDDAFVSQVESQLGRVLRAHQGVRSEVLATTARA